MRLRRRTKRLQSSANLPAHLAIIVGLILASAAPLPSQVLPPDSVVEGRTLAEWSADWWQWAFSISTNQQPLFDTTGAWANVGQPEGPVFFLAGVVGISGVERRAFSVPEGKRLFFPLVNVWVDNVGVTPPMSVEELRQIAAGYVDNTVEMHASLDGMPLPNLWDYRASSPVFSFDHPTADNIETLLWGQPVVGLVDPMVSDGYWLMLEPLSPGTHVLNFGGTYGTPFNFTVDITDTITVAATSLAERVEALMEQVQGASLPANRRPPLTVSLQAARASFARDQVQAGVSQLRAFQNKLRAQVAPGQPDLAEDLSQAAQQIIERARRDLK